MIPRAVHVVRRRLAASDPGRLRLITASATALAVLLSVSAASVTLTVVDGDSGYYVMAGILAMMSIAAVKDPTPGSRATTTALLAVPATLSIVTAAGLSAHRGAAVVGFIAVAGAATWPRRFGPRGAALGTVGFFAYFLTMLLDVDITHIWLGEIVAMTAIGSALLVRLALLRQRPRRQIILLLDELCAASDAVCAAAGRPHDDPHGGPHDDGGDKRLTVLRQRMAAVVIAVSDWQRRHDTSTVLGVDATTLSQRVFDVQVSTEQAAIGTDADRSHAAALDRVTTATEAVREVGRSHPSASSRPTTSTDSVPAHRRSPTPTTAAAPTSTPAPAPAQTWRFWRRWRPTTRTAAQVTVATALATVAGEAISASRWYWAVLTAYVVFVGTTTRAATLTRAERRVVGTVVGVVVGTGVVVVLGHHIHIELAICVICVFLAFYFGPLNYEALVLFVTIMIAVLFDLLGVFDLRLVMWRAEETAVGAVVGVIAAYLLFSNESRGALIDAVDSWIDAVQTVIRRSVHAMCGGPDADVLAASRGLDTAEAAVAHTTASMSLALLTGAGSATNRTLLVLHRTTPYAHALASTAIGIAEGTAGGTSDRCAGTVTESPAIVDAGDIALRTAEAVRQTVHRQQGQPSVDAPGGATDVPVPDDDRVSDAVAALSRLNRALLLVPGVEDSVPRP
ncbi:FUSC family protein [Gordonia sp. NPDC003950]